MLAIFPGATSRVSSPRSYCPAVTASVSNASTAAATARSRKCSGNMVSESLVLPAREVGSRPVQRPFFPDVKESGKNQHHKDKHFDKRQHFEFPEHNHPRVQKNSLDIKKDKQHSDQVEFHAEALPRIAGGHNARFIRHILDAVAHAFSQ